MMNARIMLTIGLLLAFVGGCWPSNESTATSVFAVNPQTGEKKEFASDEEVPPGWAACASEDECPDPLACDELPEAACVEREDCEPVYVGVGAYPPECESEDPAPDFCDGTLYTGCLAAVDGCEQTDCGAIPLPPGIICPDGTVGGSTGRCVTMEDGTCGWEILSCEDPCSETVPECDLLCPPGTHNPVDECGQVHTCECVADDCSDIPACEFLCPEGTHNPVDENGCEHTCECAPDSTDCTAEECGPAPGCPSYTCPDGSIGGCTGLCLRLDDGSCGWEIRQCPAEGLQWYATCGDPVCGAGHHDSGLPLCTTEKAGDPCATAGASCDPVNDCNSYLVCASEDPRQQEGGCPISRRAFKQDIHYLSPGEKSTYVDELMRIRLATYRYRAAPDRMQLGFIIEDQEPSAVVDSGRDMVDLYAYTSMVVATLQAQSEEMRALRVEIADLRSQLERTRKANSAGPNAVGSIAVRADEMLLSDMDVCIADK